MGASLSNPHFLAFADHYNDARDAGRAPMNSLPCAVAAVETEVSRRLVAAEATRSDAREVREDDGLCVCCLDRPRDIVFLSCMHVVVCEQCAPRTASCPTCRVPITEKRRIFR